MMSALVFVAVSSSQRSELQCSDSAAYSSLFFAQSDTEMTFISNISDDRRGREGQQRKAARRAPRSLYNSEKAKKVNHC